MKMHTALLTILVILGMNQVSSANVKTGVERQVTDGVHTHSAETCLKPLMSIAVVNEPSEESTLRYQRQGFQSAEDDWLIARSGIQRQRRPVHPK